MFDLNWNEIICSRFKDDNLINYHSVFLQSKNKITEKQKDYIKNLFYQLLYSKHETAIWVFWK